VRRKKAVLNTTTQRHHAREGFLATKKARITLAPENPRGHCEEVSEANDEAISYCGATAPLQRSRFAL